MQVLFVAETVKLLLCDWHDTLQRSLIGVEKPWLRCLEACVGWVVAQTRLEANMVDASLRPCLCQVLNVSRVAVPIKVEN